jgi:hypothetical protein
MRNSTSFAYAEQEGYLDGTDTSIEDIPATKYEGGHRLEIWHPHVTVVIFGADPAQIDLFAPELTRGPSVLTDLESSGIVFDPDCIYTKGFCSGDRVGVWYDDMSGLCFNLATDPPQNWCSGQPDPPVDVWFDLVDGLCFSADTDPPKSWCSSNQPTLPVGVWYGEEEGLCLTFDVGTPKTWCSGPPNDPPPAPVTVWQDPEEGLCLRLDDAYGSTWCTGTIDA